MDKNINFETKNICKSYGPTKANKNVDLIINKPEIRGIIGENGSGKSTLSSIIAGINDYDKGDMYINGEGYIPKGPVDANKKGVSIVVQELGLVQELTVAENIFLGKTKKFTNKGIINRKKLYDSAKEELNKRNITDINPNKIARELTVEEKKLVELSRALVSNPDIIIFDEITAALSESKRDYFYDLIKHLKSQGIIVIVISHDLQEILEICDTITVMKDGEIVDTVENNGLTEEYIRKMMIGRDIKDMYFRKQNDQTSNDKVVMEIKNLNYKDKFSNLDFSLHNGEILGIAGLNGCGMHALGKVLFGLKNGFNGKIYLPDKKINITDVFAANQNGVSYVPKDRDDEGLMLKASVEENICLPSINEITGKFGFISPNKKNKFSIKVVDDFQIKTTSVKQNINALSGGNKQKVSLGSWMVRDDNILILDSPTRGVDVQVKSYLYKRIIEAKKQGTAVLLISDELPELIGLSDRIKVMKNGEIKKTFERNNGFSEEDIIEVMI